MKTIAINMEHEHDTILYTAFLNCAFVHPCLHVCKHPYQQKWKKNREGAITKCLNTLMEES